jgi:hypothetical protein
MAAPTRQRNAPPPRSTCANLHRLLASGLLAAASGLAPLHGQTAAPALPAVSVADETVPEGNAGSTTITFVVELSAPPQRPVTVRYTTLDGTALAAEGDYDDVAGTLTFPAGITSATVEVVVQGDTIEEPDELFFLLLTGADGATLGDDRAEAEIVDDDGGALPGGGATLSIADAQVSEGDGGRTRLQLVVELSAPVPVPVTVELATADGSATAGEDYEPASGRLRFPPRTTRRTFSVSVLGDGAEEGDEDFVVGLANPSGAELGGDTAVVSILDDDAAGALTLEIVGSPERRGRPGGSVVLQVRVRNAGGGAVTRAPVHWMVDGDAALLDGPTTLTARNGMATQRVLLGTGSGRLAVRADDDTHTETVLFQIAVSDPPG